MNDTFRASQELLDELSEIASALKSIGKAREALCNRRTRALSDLIAIRTNCNHPTNTSWRDTFSEKKYAECADCRLVFRVKESMNKNE